MKGVFLTILNKMVEETYGLTTWDSMLLTLKPDSQGAYTSGENYPDEEMVALVNELARKQESSPHLIWEEFGQFTTEELLKIYPAYFHQFSTAKSFIKSVDQDIHGDVAKWHTDAILPKITCEDSEDNRLVVKYESKRRLCDFMKGLILGTGRFYKTRIEVAHPVCLNQGGDSCRFELTFYSEDSPYGYPS